MSSAIERMAEQGAEAGAWMLAQSDGEDGPYVIAQWGDGNPTVMIDQLTLGDFEQIHQLTDAVLRHAGVIPEREISDDRAEAPEMTEEELLQAKLWDATRYSQELDRLYGLRSHLRSTIHRKNGRAGLAYIQGEFDDNPLYQAVVQRITEVQALLDGLTD